MAVNLRRTLIGIAVAAIAVRCFVWCLAIFAFDVPPERFQEMRDGTGFLAYAAAVREGADGFERLTAYDRRAFPGYPLLLALVNAPRWPWIALAINTLASGVAAALTFLIFRDTRTGLAMALLTPSYLLYSTTIMSEAVVLCVGLAALYAGLRERPWISGLLFGCTAVLRPLAVPIGLAYFVARRRHPRELIVSASLVFFVVGTAIVWLRWWSGDIASGVSALAMHERSYQGAGIFSWPFRSLVSVPLQHTVPLWKIAYVWLHVVFVLIGLVRLLRERPRQDSAIVWLAFNTAICVSIGGIWGFHEFHRFIILALPPLFYAWRGVLPRSTPGWILLAIGSAGLAAKGLAHAW